MKSIRKIFFDGINYYCGYSVDFADFIWEKLQKNKLDKIIIVHINLRNYYYLLRNKNLKEEIINNCLVVFEGIGMKIGFFLKGFGFIPDLNGTDLIPLIFEKSVNSGHGFFLLGTKAQIIENTAEIIKKKYPGINICGLYNGYFSKDEEFTLVKNINNSRADILLIGMGFPLQENFILKYKNILNIPLIWNVGGLFDTLSGNKKRAPQIMLKLRLEWLYRLINEPARMVHRNTIAALWSLGHIIFTRSI